MNLKEYTAPTVEPVTVAELKEQLRLVSSAQDAMLARLIKAARERAEKFTRRSFINTTWELTLDRFPIASWSVKRWSGRVIELPRGRLQSVTSVKYLDDDAATQTFAAAGYTVDTDDEPGRIVLNTDYSWPETGEYPSAVRIRFIAGYGAASTAVPEMARLAVLWLASHYYSHPTPVNVGNIVTPIPEHINAVLWDLRVHGFGYSEESA